MSRYGYNVGGVCGCAALLGLIVFLLLDERAESGMAQAWLLLFDRYFTRKQDGNE